MRFFIILVSIGVRIYLMTLPSFGIDMSAWLAWAYRLADLGPGGFYSDTVWTQYTPGVLYWLWFIGSVGWVHALAIKIPLLLCDIVTAYLIYRVVEKHNQNRAWWVIPLYLLNPALAFTDSVWGQIDGLLTLFLFLSFYLAYEKNKIISSGIAWALALLIKPQALAFLPVLVVVWMKSKKWIRIGIASLISGLVIVAGSVLFFPSDPVFGLPKLIGMMGQFYHYTSLYAYNIWALTTSMWKDDQTVWGYFSYQQWGTILYVSALIICTMAFFFRQRNYYVFASLILFSFFLFPTRVHERYLLPFFAFFLAFVFLSKKTFWIVLYIFFSLVYLANIYYPYAYYTDTFLRSEGLMYMIERSVVPISISMLVLFGSLLAQLI